MKHIMKENKSLLLKKEIIKKFSNDFRSKIYTILRLKLSPMLQLEKYVPQKGNILDLGCGSGIFAHILYLGSRERKILGIDLSYKRIETANKISNNNSHLRFMVGDVNNIPFDDIGIITLIDLLHHMTFADQNKLLKKIHTKLHDGGLLLIKDLEKQPLWKYIFHYIQDSISYKGAKLYFRSAKQMSDLLTHFGFTVEIISLASGYPHPHILYKCRKSSGQLTFSQSLPL